MANASPFYSRFAVLSVVTLTCCSWLPRLTGQEPMIDDPDYVIQGEYVGSMESQPNLKIGCQIIARGEGKFDLVAFINGLPGDGGESSDGEASPADPVAGEWIDDEVVFEGDSNRGVIKDGVLSVYRGETLVASLEKTTRQSPTLGEAPPEGAIVLFDGSTADAFDNGEISGGLLQATNCSSKELLDDHQLHIEFRTPYMPEARGQGRGNSGVYVQSRYEVQVLDSFGLEGLDNECGGIYSISRPDVNACYPPMVWQTYDIDFTAARYDEAGDKIKNARITVRLNGALIHDDLELPHGTPGRNAEGPGPDALFLQDHSNPVEFRNIWVIKK